MSKDIINLSYLQSIASRDNLSLEVTDALLDVIRKEKEKQVLQRNRHSGQLDALGYQT